MNNRLDFLVVGVQKSGTTTLDQYLRLHSAIGMPNKKKELHFFDKPANFSKGIEFYHAFYAGSDDKKVWGECTPIYSYWEGVLENIYQYNPNMKLIMVLRNPIERAFSHWNMEFFHGREALSFYDALKREQSRLSEMPNNQHRVYSYVDRGRYISQIKKIWNLFGKKKLHIIKMDELVKSPERVMNSIYDFLDVERQVIKQPICSYAGEYNKKMTKIEREFLFDSFEQEITSLECLLGWDCRSWLDVNN